jgi:hypothetical protein
VRIGEIARKSGLTVDTLRFYERRGLLPRAARGQWVLFEETVVDKYGLWQYMPHYRVARLCSWDIGALALIILSTSRLLRRRSA